MCDDCFEEMMKEKAKEAAWYVVPTAALAVVVGPLATAGLIGGAALVSTAINYISTTNPTPAAEQHHVSSHSDDDYEVVSLS